MKTWAIDQPLRCGMAFPGKITWFDATKDEVRMTLPGDDLVASPILEATQARAAARRSRPYMLPARLRDRVSGELTEAFLLTRLESGGTRVLRRMRATCRPLAFRLVAVPLVLIWGELITARNFLRGLKRRAEGAPAPARP